MLDYFCPTCRTESNTGGACHKCGRSLHPCGWCEQCGGAYLRAAGEACPEHGTPLIPTPECANSTNRHTADRRAVTKKVYTAPDVMTAHLFKAFLMENGFPSAVEEQELSMLWPTVPLAFPSVIVNIEDYDQARELVAEFERKKSAPEAPLPSWRCSKCDEACDGQFAACWNCGNARPEEE